MACLLVKDAVWLLPSTPALVSAPLVAREYRGLRPERGREKRARSETYRQLDKAVFAFEMLAISGDYR